MMNSPSSPPRRPEDKVIDRDKAGGVADELREAGHTLVFTNGCYDIIHRGHVDYLTWARSQGDVLFVGVNADASVRRYKGDLRPINDEHARAHVLAALECVDWVVVFEEDEPAELIGQILPHVLVKGADWAHYVSGREIVERHGGRVALAHMTPGCSTSGIIARITEAYGKDRI